MFVSACSTYVLRWILHNALDALVQSLSNVPINRSVASKLLTDCQHFSSIFASILLISQLECFLLSKSFSHHSLVYHPLSSILAAYFMLISDFFFLIKMWNIRIKFCKHAKLLRWQPSVLAVPARQCLPTTLCGTPLLNEVNAPTTFYFTTAIIIYIRNKTY